MNIRFWTLASYVDKYVSQAFHLMVMLVISNVVGEHSVLAGGCIYVDGAVVKSLARSNFTCFYSNSVSFDNPRVFRHLRTIFIVTLRNCRKTNTIVYWSFKWLNTFSIPFLKFHIWWGIVKWSLCLLSLVEVWCMKITLKVLSTSYHW